MSLFAALRKNLSPLTLLAAGTLSVSLFAEDAEQISVSTEAELRAALSEKYQPEGTTEESDLRYHDGAEITLTTDISVNTTLPEDETDAATGTIEVLATDVKILGNGKTISSSLLSLETSGSGDLFFLNGTTLSVGDISFSGTTDETQKTGRVFATGNGTSSKINIGAGTCFSDRRLVADEYTNYRAIGGALVSGHITDEISLTSSDIGDISFISNVAHGRMLTYVSNEEEVTETLSAQGGALAASGLVTISGAGTTLFQNNSAISDASTAQGGAVYIVNASLNANGSLSSSSLYPDSVKDESGTKKFGLQVESTTLNFSGNSARGASAAGGAVAVVGGYFDATDSALAFSSNAVANTAEAGTLGGGALILSEGAKATFDAGTTQTFENNSATAGAVRTTASGGAVAVSASTLSLTGTTTFSENTVSSAFGGATLSGGALFFEGVSENVTNDDGSKTKTYTTNATLAGTLTFNANKVSATALSADTGTEDAEIVESSARGGAIALSGGKIDGATLTALTFAGNTAESKTLAAGGAMASVSSDTVFAAKTSGDLLFENNNATLLALDENETQTDGVTASVRGGAIFMSSGEIGLDAAGTLNFSGNTADATTQGSATAQGGAIFQSAGTLALGGTTKIEANRVAATETAQGGAAYFSDSATATFSGSVGFSDNVVTARLAQGGAIYAAGGTQSFEKSVTFSGNEAVAGSATDAAGTTFARGGAIFVAQNGALSFSGETTFSGNEAGASTLDTVSANGAKSGAAGGAVYSAGTLAFGETVFSSNVSDVDGDPAGAAFGGAVYVAGGKFSAATSMMTDNSATASGEVSGGAVYVASAGLLDIAGDFSLSENNATSVSSGTGKGGAIYSAGTVRVGGKFSATENSVSGATLSAGGAVFVSGGSFTIDGDSAHEISGNKLTTTAGDAFGGAIYVADGGSFAQTAGSISISGNTATATGGSVYGGAIYLGGGNVTLTNTTIEGNSADAIYIDVSKAKASTLTLNGSTEIADTETLRVGFGTGTEAKSAATIVFNTDDGNATIGATIFADAGTTLNLKKTGDDDLTLGNVGAGEGAKISFFAEGGITIFKDDVAQFEELTVAGDAGVSFGYNDEESRPHGVVVGGWTSATIEGDVYFISGSREEDPAILTLVDGSTTKLTGTLKFMSIDVNVLGNATISGSGAFELREDSTFYFNPKASLTVQNMTLYNGTFTLDGAGTLNVTETLTFKGMESVIELSNGATLGLVEVAHIPDGEGEVPVLTISGTGTLVIYADASDVEEIDFAKSFETVEDENGETTTTLYAGTVEIGSGVTVKAGLSVSEGVTLKLSPSSQVVGQKNILLKGGTLLTDAGATLELEKISVSGDAVSVLGAEGEAQVFKMVETTTVVEDEDGNETTETSTAALDLRGTLNITETTKFVGDVEFGDSAAVLSGAGTVEGNVSGTGTVSIAKIVGDLNIANNRGMTIDGTVSVNGNVNVYDGRTAGVTANAKLTLAENSLLSANTISNFGVVTANAETCVAGNFVNAGTLKVSENSTLTFAENSTFTNGFASASETLAGTIDLSAKNSAIDFSAIADESNITLDNGTVLIDATKLASGDALPVFGIEDETLFENLTLEDVNDYALADRFVWDADAGKLVFLGLNGEAFRGTLYGDLQRESVNATHGFMRSALLRGLSRPILPELYGVYKLESPYMRGYIEKMRQRGGEVSAKIEAQHKAELARAEKLNSRLMNFWAQGDFSFGEQRERGGFDSYDATREGILFGASIPFESWEFGLALSAGSEEYKTKSAAVRHKAETDALGLTGYGRYRDEWFDWTVAAAGMHTSTDSTRGEFSGDFDGWRFGAMTEFGATLTAQSWLVFRAYWGLSAAYSYVGSCDESGGDGALSVDSDGAFGVRSSLGLSSAFAVNDALQFKIHAAWLLDFGTDTFSLDAYMPSTRTRYVIDSRDNENSALEAGATMNWTTTDSTELFGGYTGTIRSGERVHAFSVGINYFF